ncbi:MAG: DNA repair protein RecO [Verrucomicrobia bacterium]|nr:DNA repair protein RecO [Verrucomicrobiota bacterium]
MEERVQAIVLKTLDYRDHQRIVTLMTEQMGLLSFLIRGLKKENRFALTTPFSHGEYVLKKGKGELLSFRDGTLFSDHETLRTNYQFLKTAGDMASLLLKTQLPGKPAPKLFALFLAYLGKVAHFEDTRSLPLSFMLKLMTHDGWISWEDKSFFPISVTEVEWKLLKTLALSRSFSQLRGLSPSSDLYERMQCLNVLSE